MAMIAINQHDWSALETEFERRARAAGIEKGTLAWYGFSTEVQVPKPDMPDLTPVARLVDQLLLEAERITGAS